MAAAVAAGVAAAAWRLRALTAGGAVAAWSVGTAILVGTGWDGGAVLAAFFVSSTVVDRVAARLGSGLGVGFAGPSPPGQRDIDMPLPNKHTVLQGHTDVPLLPHPERRGEQRNAWQVYANGGVAAVCAVAAGWFPGPAFWLVTVSLAAAAADTWATSLGGLSRRSPRLLGLGPVVSRGTNGGMSLLGTGGGLVGAIVVTATGALVGDVSLLWSVGTLIGFGGMVIDSLLGAAVQGRFACSDCGVDSDRQVHRCGARTMHVGGMGWLTNDGVNFLATAAAALAGVIAAAIAWPMSW